MRELLLALLCGELRSEEVWPSHHFLQRLLERDMPSLEEIEAVVCDDDPEIIEPRPDEALDSTTILVWGHHQDRVFHICSTYPPEAILITAYWPDEHPEEWTDDTYKRRVRP